MRPFSSSSSELSIWQIDGLNHPFSDSVSFCHWPCAFVVSSGPSPTSPPGADPEVATSGDGAWGGRTNSVSGGIVTSGGRSPALSGSWAGASGSSGVGTTVAFVTTTGCSWAHMGPGAGVSGMGGSVADWHISIWAWASSGVGKSSPHVPQLKEFTLSSGSGVSC